MKKVMILVVMTVLGLHTQAQIVSSRSSMVTREVIDDSKVYKGWSTFGIEYLPSTWSYSGGERYAGAFTGIALNYTNAISLTQKLPLFLEWGVGVQYSYRSEDGVTDYYTSVKVPVNLMYDFEIPNTKINVAPYFGLKFRGNLWGKEKYDDDYYDKGFEDSFDLFGNDIGAERFQIGWNIGAKARFNNKFFVGFAYGSDFNEIIEDVTVKEVSLSVGLVF